MTVIDVATPDEFWEMLARAAEGEFDPNPGYEDSDDIDLPNSYLHIVGGFIQAEIAYKEGGSTTILDILSTPLPLAIGRLHEVASNGRYWPLYKPSVGETNALTWQEWLLNLRTAWLNQYFSFGSQPYWSAEDADKVIAWDVPDGTIQLLQKRRISAVLSSTKAGVAGHNIYWETGVVIQDVISAQALYMTDHYCTLTPPGPPFLRRPLLQDITDDNAIKLAMITAGLEARLRKRVTLWRGRSRRMVTEGPGAENIRDKTGDTNTEVERLCEIGDAEARTITRVYDESGQVDAVNGVTFAKNGRK